MIDRTNFFKPLLLASIVVLSCATPGCEAQPPGHLYVVPFVYDPDNSGQSTARFFNQGHTMVLHLTKVGPTNSPEVPDGVESGATIQGAIPLHITEIGFDLGPGSQCGGGAPRFNIHDDQGHYWFFTCDVLKASPTSKVKMLPNGYLRIAAIAQDTFAPANTTEPFTAQTNVSRLNLAFDVGTDEGTGFANLANVTVNNQVCIPHMASH